MTYAELKRIALQSFPNADSCYDCGGVLHFVCEDTDIKGMDVTLVKETGRSVSFVMAIEEGLVAAEGMQLDFQTGKPLD